MSKLILRQSRKLSCLRAKSFDFLNEIDEQAFFPLELTFIRWIYPKASTRYISRSSQLSFNHGEFVLDTEKELDFLSECEHTSENIACLWPAIGRACRT